MIARVLALLALLGSTPVAPELRQPTGKWVVNFADSQCILSRDYGTPGLPLTLTFEPSVMGDRMKLVVLRSGKSREILRRPAKIWFDPSQMMIETNASAYGVENRDLVRIDVGIDRVQIESALNAQSVTIDAQDLANLSLALPGFRSALKVLDACRADLLATWGIPVELQAKFRTPAKPIKGSLAAYFSANDNPTSGSGKNSHGRVRARIGIEASGGVSRCDVVSSSGSKLFDDTTCRIILRRVRYSPALDVYGKPMPSIDIADVSWLAP
jgi:TonB family protein